jgi:hypothetical protein
MLPASCRQLQASGLCSPDAEAAIAIQRQVHAFRGVSGISIDRSAFVARV